MTQMIMNGIYLPEMDNDTYSCWESVLTVQVEMISGRMVTEVRNSAGAYKVWRARAAFDYLEDGIYQKIYPVLKSGKPFQASVLPPNQTTLVSGTFMLESITEPSFAFDDGGPVWHGLAFQIREVRPHA